MEFHLLYQKVVDYILESGKRLLSKSGNIKDIGITKKDLTEEDIAIERGFKKLVEKEGHFLYGEEENFDFQDKENLWVVDPVSHTSSFIKGMGHYAVVASHLYKSEVVFAAVYDPTVDELFTAVRGKGSFLNGRRISVSDGGDEPPSVIYNRSAVWRGTDVANGFWLPLNKYATVYRNTSSFAVNYCWVACGRFDGVVALTKDSFTEYAGSLIIKEAGGLFTNYSGDGSFLPTDRGFVGGNPIVYRDLLELTTPLFRQI